MPPFKPEVLIDVGFEPAARAQLGVAGAQDERVLTPLPHSTASNILCFVYTEGEVTRTFLPPAVQGIVPEAGAKYY